MSVCVRDKGASSCVVLHTRIAALLHVRGCVWCSEMRVDVWREMAYTCVLQKIFLLLGAFACAAVDTHLAPHSAFMVCESASLKQPVKHSPQTLEGVVADTLARAGHPPRTPACGDVGKRLRSLFF